jgi:hypothetical protein
MYAPSKNVNVQSFVARQIKERLREMGIITPENIWYVKGISLVLQPEAAQDVVIQFIVRTSGIKLLAVKDEDEVVGK